MNIVFSIVFVIVSSLTLYNLYRKFTTGICKCRTRLDGMTCLVTGGTSGVGLEISTDFARRGARVIVACPFEEEGINGRKRIIKESGNNNVVFKLLDLSSFDSVRQFARDISETEERLDILMNNAGIAHPPKSTDPYPKVMVINYLGHFLLTVLLFPLLQKSGTPTAPSRIVNTPSMVCKMANLDVENLLVHKNKGFLGELLMYGNSKLCLVLFSLELKKRFPTPNVVINNADPGVVATRIFLNDGSLHMYLTYVLHSLTAKSPLEGAQTALHVALDETAGRMSGQFYRDCKLCQTPEMFKDEALASKLWDKSMELVQLRDEELQDLLQ
ncbi:hypothetical protein ABMA28_015939 [Loxostege sticticalis]|uniref:Retinol dehydrogenase 11 n=1 Tax=Loxostege sticticalis TaxID=481309 RepID=A0ABD0TBN0_LOXSC